MFSTSYELAFRSIQNCDSGKKIFFIYAYIECVNKRERKKGNEIGRKQANSLSEQNRLEEKKKIEGNTKKKTKKKVNKWE